MKHIRNIKFEIHTQQRILLFLIGALTLFTLILASIVGDMQRQLRLNGVLGKDATTQSLTSSKSTSQSTSTSTKSGGTSGGNGSTKNTGAPRLTLAPTSHTSPSHTSPSPIVSTMPLPTFVGSGDISPNSPACPPSAHTNNKFHTLWDPVLRCHYDHEHGQNPFTSAVAATFPGFNLRTLMGNVEIGHTNPSSPMENTHKHGGFKWQFTAQHPQNCAGFEGAANGVNSSAIQIHGFGDYAIELQGRIHSSMALLRMCNQSNPTDYGYLYTVQFQDYGQIVSPYQGDVVPYPFTPFPAYSSPRGPYLTFDCFGQKAPGERGTCRESLAQVVNSRRLNASSNWSSKPTGRENITNPFGSTLFNVFFRLRDTYQLMDWSDQTYPFTFRWLCSSDGGLTYDPRGCRYNNSTIQVHEVAGTIPTSWDNLSGFDTDTRVGRITATGFTDRFGNLNRSCTTTSVDAAGGRSGDCFPVKMVNAFVGKYGSVLFFTGPGKGTNLTPYLPENDIYFCNGRVCSEDAAGAVPSGWIGQNN